MINRQVMLRDKGEEDFRSGRSIDAYQNLSPSDFGRARLREGDRANYEIGWRFARDSARKAK